MPDRVESRDFRERARLQPCRICGGSNGFSRWGEAEQGLKPNERSRHTARLKPCPLSKIRQIPLRPASAPSPLRGDPGRGSARERLPRTEPRAQASGRSPCRGIAIFIFADEAGFMTRLIQSSRHTSDTVIF